MGIHVQYNIRGQNVFSLIQKNYQEITMAIFLFQQVGFEDFHKILDSCQNVSLVNRTSHFLC